MLGAVINGKTLETLQEKNPNTESFTLDQVQQAAASAVAQIAIDFLKHRSEKANKEKDSEEPQKSENPEDLINKGLDLFLKNKTSKDGK